MKIKLGKIELLHGLALAPMAGYTDRAMRRVCRDSGAEISYTEMISARATVFRDKKTERLSRIFSDEGPVILQIFGSEPSIMGEAAGLLEGGGTDEGAAAPVGIDINMGCPVNKIFSNNEGSALMKNPSLIYKIVKSVTESISIPCTVKLRAGIDESHINAVECALAAEEGGASALTVHGRTRAQLYSGEADRGIIKSVKEAVKIPVFANGDIRCYEDALSMLSDTGCDGIMVGRAAIGNPFIFSEILSGLENKSYTPPTVFEKAEIAKKELMLAVLDKGERCATAEARGKIALYFKGYAGCAALRAEINTATTYESVVSSVDKFLYELEKTAE